MLSLKEVHLKLQAELQSQIYIQNDNLITQQKKQS